MYTTNLKSAKIPGRRLIWMAALLFSLLAIVHPQLGFSQAPQERTFSSPGEAAAALFQAVQNEDEQGVEAILGAGKEVTSTSDEAEDRLEREQFSQKYQEMHRLVQEADGTTVLYIGAENWPFPIPLVSKGGQWYFDSETGKQEITFRRVGENESTAIQVCEEFAMANNDAAVKASSEDPITQFAQTLSSTAAKADSTQPTLFHGYYFRIVTPNPADASSPRSKRSLRLIAYPAEYQSSGVKTFVVTRRGIVFEKDLGPETATIAAQMKARSGSKWRQAA